MKGKWRMDAVFMIRQRLKTRIEGAVLWVYPPREGLRRVPREIEFEAMRKKVAPEKIVRVVDEMYR